VLHSRRAQRQFTYELELSPGLTARERGGQVELVDAAGEPQMTFTAPFMYDASHTPDKYSRDVRLELTGAGDGQRLRLVADEGWLDDPDRAYPVVIDPTVTYNGSARLNNAAQATYLDSMYPSETTLGQDPELWAGDESTDQTSHDHKALLKFDVETAVPRYSTVLSATLGLYVLDKTWGTNQGCLHAHEGVRTFTEHANWNTSDGARAWSRPGGDYAGVVSEDRSPTVGQWLRFDQLQNLTQRWVDGSTDNAGVVIDACNDTPTSYLLASDEHPDPARAPYLEIWYRGPMGAPSDHTFLAPKADGTDATLAGPEPHTLPDVNVDVASGALLLRAADDAGAGSPTDLHLDRFYNSFNYTSNTAFGRGWTEGEGHWLKSTQQTDGSRVFNAPAMAPLRFTRQPDGTWQSPAGFDGTLTANGDGTNTVRFNRTATSYRESGGPAASMTSFTDADGTRADRRYDSADGSYANKTRTVGTATTTYTHLPGNQRLTDIHSPDGKR